MAVPGIILASASPRRVELLREFGLEFSVIPSRAEELHDEAVGATRLCAVNAERKAEEVARSHPDRITLGADTLVTLDGALFGKPRDEAQAAEMLGQLSGRTHEVITGVCLALPGQGKREVFTASTWVTFKALSREEIASYISAVHVLDKAGAYGIQERGELLVERIEGSLSNVIGLPVERLAEAFVQWRLINPHERDRIVDRHRSQSPGTSTWFRK